MGTRDSSFGGEFIGVKGLADIGTNTSVASNELCDLGQAILFSEPQGLRSSLTVKVLSSNMTAKAAQDHCRMV